MKKVETTAADTKVVRTFARFAKSGYKPSLFTRDLYLALSRSFGFIAHYDRDGFYAARFGGSAARLDTLMIMGYETFQWVLSALEQQFRKLVLDEKLVVAVAEQLTVETVMKTVTIGDILTPAQLTRCRALYPDRARIRDEVVRPNMGAINRRLGQENDPDYLSYAIVHAIGVAEEGVSANDNGGDP